MKPTLQFQFDDLGALHRFLTKIIPVVDDGTLTAATMQTLKEGAEKYKPVEAPAPVPAAPAPLQGALQAAAPAPVVPQAPVAPVVPAQPVAPQQMVMPQTVPQPVEAPAPVPSTAPSYKMDDLARAAASVVDAGKQPELMQILASFGVVSLPEIPADQYGAVATALRGLGAQI